jgi:hypothetical protein
MRDGVFGLFSALIAGLATGLGYELTYTLIHRANGGPIGALILVLGPLFIAGWEVGRLITLVETMNWRWSQFWKPMIGCIFSGLALGLIVGLVYLGEASKEKISRLIFALVGGLIVGLILGLATGFVGGLSHTVKANKASPNQGILLSVRNALIAFFVTSLISGLIVGFFAEITLGRSIGPTVGVISGLIVGSVAGLSRGGSAVIKHYTLRLCLWLNDNTPLNFVKFLDQSAKLIFLKKVGGGYIFIHRMLLDYFADLPQFTKGRNGKTKSVQS